MYRRKSLGKKALKMTVSVVTVIGFTFIVWGTMRTLDGALTTIGEAVLLDLRTCAARGLDI